KKADVIELRYLPETGRLEAWNRGRRLAQGYCGEQGEWMYVVGRSFPGDREIASLAPGFKNDPYRWLGPCGDWAFSRLPDRSVLDLVSHADTLLITRLVQAGEMLTDVETVQPRFMRGWMVKSWVPMSAPLRIEANRLLADNTTWRGNPSVDW